VPAGEAPGVVAHLVACESQGVSVKHPDSNDRYSYGVLQIQSTTWAQFEASSGIEGSPMNATTAISVGIWAIENGEPRRRVGMVETFMAYTQEKLKESSFAPPTSSGVFPGRRLFHLRRSVALSSLSLPRQ
jgi:hypothetical protein